MALNKLYEADVATMTAAELAKAGVRSVTGYGGTEIPVNANGFLVNPASKFSLLDKFKELWNSSGGDVDKFMGMNVNGSSVHDIFTQMPSQQAFGVGKAIGLPSGTNVPAETWGSGHWTAIKLGSGNVPIPPTDGGAASGVASGAGAAIPPDGGASAGAAIASWPIPITPEVAISALIIGGGIYAAIKALGNTIKARFRKCAKVLWNMQKDFVSEEGLNMKKVLPGVGNWFTDLWAKIFYGPKSNDSDSITGSSNSGAIGTQPFIRRYFAEIKNDYKSAVNAFNSIAITGKTNFAHESIGKFNSFREALISNINEGTEKDTSRTSFNNKIDPRNIYNNGGNLCYKNGSTEVKINVTKESTREVASAIMAMFLNKYTNSDKIYKKLGIDTLGEIDQSNIEKFSKVINMYKGDILREKEGNGAKLYGRMREAYNKMIDAYIGIGNRVIKNFEKYTKNKKGEAGKSSIDQKGLSEKDDNLLFTSVKKLDTKWDQQKDYFKNNFDKIVLAVVESKDYQAYINFIIEKVLPIFKTGEAGNADVILDITPKKGEKYIIRQTRDDSVAKTNLTLGGNVAIAEIENFDFGKQEITFKLYGKVNDPRAIKVSGKNKASYHIDNEHIDTNAYADRKPITMSYHTFMSLDPEQLEHDEDYKTLSEDEDKFYVYEVTTNDGTYEIIAKGEISVNKKDNTQQGQTNGGSTETSESAFTPDVHINEDDSQNDNKNIIISQILCYNKNTHEKNMLLDIDKSLNLDKVKLDKMLTNIRAAETKTNVEQNDYEKLVNGIANKQQVVNQDELNKNIYNLISNTSHAKDDRKNIKNALNVCFGSLLEILHFNIDANDNTKLTIDVNKSNNNIKDWFNKNAQYNFNNPKAANYLNIGIENESYVLKTNCITISENDNNIIFKVMMNYDSSNDILLITSNLDNKFKFSEKSIKKYLEPQGAQQEQKSNNQNTNFKLKNTDITAIAQKYTSFVINDEAYVKKLQYHFNDKTQEFLQSIKEGIECLFDFSYDTLINESCSSIKVSRKIKTSSSYNGYYILSKNAWSDGSHLNVNNYLKESLWALCKNNTYDNICSAVKNDHSFKIYKVNENFSYKTILPINTYGLNSSGNILYEGVQLVKFDKNGKLNYNTYLNTYKVY